LNPPLVSDVWHANKILYFIILSGDGNFLPVLKHLKETGKEIIVLSRGKRTAKEIRQFAGANFRDYEYFHSRSRLESAICI
jgi:uncharacterized LabA/DUF88 family protein